MSRANTALMFIVWDVKNELKLLSKCLKSESSAEKAYIEYRPHNYSMESSAYVKSCSHLQLRFKAE